MDHVKEELDWQLVVGGWWLVVENEGDDKRDVNNEQICYFVDRLAVFYVILTI